MGVLRCFPFASCISIFRFCYFACGGSWGGRGFSRCVVPMWCLRSLFIYFLALVLSRVSFCYFAPYIRPCFLVRGVLAFSPAILRCALPGLQYGRVSFHSTGSIHRQCLRVGALLTGSCVIFPGVCVVSTRGVFPGYTFVLVGYLYSTEDATRPFGSSSVAVVFLFCMVWCI